MPVTCPCCKASNDSGPVCRRCKADLGLLFQLESDRAALLAAGDAERAHQLRRGDDSRRMLAVARLLQGDFAGALAAHRERNS